MAEQARLRREAADLGKDWDVSGVGAEPVGGSLGHFAARIKGPAGTPYEGGVFGVDIKIPPQYPFEPPKMRFTTQLWHPNVSSQTGAICLDILKDAWSPALTLKTALLSLQALLSAPEPKDPQDAEVARQYLDDPKKWAATAKFWTDSYARGSSPATPAAGAGAGGTPPSPGPGGGGSGASSASAALAAAASAERDPALAKLLELGFERERAAKALKAAKGDVNRAIEALFSS